MKTLAEYLGEHLGTEIEKRQEACESPEGTIPWDTGDLIEWIRRGLDTIELARVIKWPESQICQECEHGKLLLDMPSGDTACMKAVHPIGGRCKYLSRKELDTNDS